MSQRIQIPELAEVFGSASYFRREHAHMLAEADEEPDLAGWPERVNRQDILNSIPSKEFADSLVAVCFINTNNEASMSRNHPEYLVIHDELADSSSDRSPSDVSQRGTSSTALLDEPSLTNMQYEKFWADPTSTPIMWVGLLFALMCLAVQYQRFSPDEARRIQIMDSEPEKLINLYHEKTIQCLILGKYTRGPPYTVETLMLYLFIESLRGQNLKNLDGPWIQWQVSLLARSCPDFDNLIVTVPSISYMLTEIYRGNLVRIAFKSGYHRDASHFPEISCFQAETRRRVWTMMVGWDLYFSVQFALPPDDQSFIVRHHGAKVSF